MATQSQLRDDLAQKLIELVKRGTPPWRRPWSTVADPARFPTNMATRKCYRGLNVLLLQAEAIEKNYPVSFWASYKQWFMLGQQVRRGEMATRVVYFKQVEKKQINAKGVEEKQKFPLLRTWPIFNIGQTNGPLADHYLKPSPPPRNDETHDEFLRAVDATQAKIRYGGPRAYYDEPSDLIQVPFESKFETYSDFLETLAHELIHSTIPEKRLGRRLSRAKEELVAEIGAAFFLQATGVPLPDLENSGAYVASWLRDIEEEDPRFILKAASLASDATDYLLSFSQSSEEARQPELVATEA